MATYGVSMVRDEADVIEGTLRHMADEVDHLIVADNNSMDGTREILDRLGGELPLTVLDDPDPAYFQSAKMSRLAGLAAEAGAAWVVPFDADELWVSPHGRIRDVLAGLRGQAVAALYNHLCTALDVAGPDPFRSMVWRQDAPGALPKMALRWEDGAVIHQGNHGVTLPSGGPRVEGLLEVRHFPYRSAEQMVRKALNGSEAYKAADLPVDQGAHWRAYGEIIERYGEEALKDWFRHHFWYISPTDSGLVLDPAPYMRWEE
jgi:glycosyltransferase involved in cell wall biosynthesis